MTPYEFIYRRTIKVSLQRNYTRKYSMLNCKNRNRISVTGSLNSQTKFHFLTHQNQRFGMKLYLLQTIHFLFFCNLTGTYFSKSIYHGVLFKNNIHVDKVPLSYFNLSHSIVNTGKCTRVSLEFNILLVKEVFLFY